MRLHPSFNLTASTLLALFATSNIVFAIREISLADDQDNNGYLPPLYHDCSENDPKCQIKEGSFVVTLHGFYRISSHLAFSEKKLQRDPTVNWQAHWHDHEKSASYNIDNVTQEELVAIRRDPGVYELEQLYYSQTDLGWDLECMITGMSEERKRLCYREIDVPQCEKSWLTQEEQTECL